MLTATSTNCTAAWLAAATGHVYRSTLTLHTHVCVPSAPPSAPTLPQTAQRKCRSVSHGRSGNVSLSIVCPMTFEIQSAAPSSDGNHKPSVAISLPPATSPLTVCVCAHSCMYPAPELASLHRPLGWTMGVREREREGEGEGERKRERE